MNTESLSRVLFSLMKNWQDITILRASVAMQCKHLEEVNVRKACEHFDFSLEMCNFAEN